MIQKSPDECKSDQKSGGRTGEVSSKLPFKLLAPLLLVALILQFTAVPSSADFTDPPHGVWTAGFTEHETTIGPGEQLQLTTYSMLTPEAPLPVPSLSYSRAYDFTLPAGSIVTYTDVYRGECTVQAETVHCEVTSELVAGFADALTLVFNPPAAVGSYTVALATTAVVGGVSYSDSDTYNLTIRQRGTADLAVTESGNPKQIAAGAEVTLRYSVVNNGPDPARDAYTVLWYRNTGLDIHVLSVTPSDSCSTRGEARVECHWGVLPTGEPRSVSVVLVANPTPQIEFDAFDTFVFSGSFENDPDQGNDSFRIRTTTRCTYFIDSLSTVDPTADLARSGCTYILEGTVAAKASIGKGAFVAISDVGVFAKMGQRAVISSRGDLRGKMGAKSAIGDFSIIIGEIGESAKIGDRVDSSAASWLVVGSKATVGSKTSFDLPRGYEQTVHISAGAKIPENTVISEQYCQSNPTICTVTG